MILLSETILYKFVVSTTFYIFYLHDLVLVQLEKQLTDMGVNGVIFLLQFQQTVLLGNLSKFF